MREVVNIDIRNIDTTTTYYHLWFVNIYQHLLFNAFFLALGKFMAWITITRIWQSQKTKSIFNATVFIIVPTCVEKEVCTSLIWVRSVLRFYSKGHHLCQEMVVVPTVIRDEIDTHGLLLIIGSWEEWQLVLCIQVSTNTIEPIKRVELSFWITFR